MKEQPRHILEKLSDFILAQKEHIIALWLNTIRSDKRIKTADLIDNHKLVNHLPQLIEELCSYLKQPVNNDIEHQVSNSSRVHGQDRWQQGYNLEELLRELAILRDLIQVDYITLFARQTPDCSLETEHLARRLINYYFSITLSSSVKRYIEERDEEARQYQRQLEALNLELNQHKESLRVRMTEAEKANQAKDEFLALVTHELKTPLTAMLGWARLLQSGNLDEESSERALETIVRNIKNQDRLISDLLDIGRIITGKFKLEISEVDISEVIESAYELVNSVAEEKSIEIKLTRSMSDGIISGDADRLRQVIVNLLTNAIKFTPAGGNISVELTRSDGNAIISVADNGDGIAPELLPHIFERYRQAQGAQAKGGLGLGLAIVRHIVELHGGTVKVESPGPGQGANFTVSLPLK